MGGNSVETSAEKIEALDEIHPTHVHRREGKRGTQSSKHFKVVGQRFASWEHAHEYAGQLEDAQRQAIEILEAGGRAR